MTTRPRPQPEPARGGPINTSDSHANSRLQASEIMSSPVVTIGTEESLGSAWNLLSGTGLRHLVVVEGNRCVGIIDDRRVVQEWPFGPLGLNGTKVGDVLQSRVRCVLVSTPVASIARIMLEERTDAVPVIAANGEVRGVVTIGDMLLVLAHEEP
jgi:acetoin utilization protein AcuB